MSNRIKLKYLISGIKHQMPWKRLYKNFFVTGNGWGLFSKYSHINKNGKEKVGYNTLATAQKSADAMKRKKNKHFSIYKCIRCGKYHLGKNRDNKDETIVKS